MQALQLKPILERYIVPMFTGSEISEHEEKRFWKLRRVFLRNVSEMVVRAAEDSTKYFLLRRSQAFDQTDAAFVECFVEHLHKIGDRIEESFVDDLINPIMRRTVAERIAPKSSKFISRILAQFENWAEQTYEGRKISAAVGVDTSIFPLGMSAVPGGGKLLDIFNEPFGVVLANGLESFLTANADGEITGYEPLNITTGMTTLFAPLRFCRLAEWAADKKIGLGLSRNGEILVFANKRLVFAKRRGIWHHFTHKAVLTRMSLTNCFYLLELRKAVYQTCLDVSFAKTGGGIALIKRTRLDALKQADIVNSKDYLGASNVKGKCLQTIIGKPFYNLDRHLRQDIVAMDGATILDYKGNVVAAGAIVKVDAGSDGGGRLAAAKTLSSYGLAIKISSDGGIRGFAPGSKDAEEIFTIG